MARFDVYPNPGLHVDTTPYLLDVQTDLLSGLDSRVVVPLRSAERFAQVKIPERLMPLLDVNGTACLMETPKLAAVPERVLQKPVASLAHDQDRVLAALDFLFQGY
ncbi:MAG: CcdB family protein [Pseudomonadota bacterium]|nr:CcdB family protein [Pseudomonadota bacterium]